MSSAPTTLICIAAHAHSGSTLLDMLLGAHSQIVSLGEVARYRHDRPRRCACGAETTDACEFWSRVDEKLMQSVGLPLGRLVLRDPGSPELAAHNRALLQAVQAITGQRVFVDSTKSLGRLHALLTLNEPGLRVLPVHLIRRPHGVVYSNIKKKRPWLWHTLNYSREMLRYRALLGHVDHLRVGYESLCSQPQHELMRIMDWLDIAYEPGQLDWAAHERHVLGGNRMRKSQDSTIRLDEQWRDKLSPAQRWTISLLTRPVMPTIGQR